MPCTPISGKTPDGHEWTGISCTRGSSKKDLGMCMTSGCSGRAEFLCDFPSSTKNGKTCDTKCCRRCAKQVGENVHHCPACWVESLKGKR